MRHDVTGEVYGSVNGIARFLTPREQSNFVVTVGCLMGLPLAVAGLCIGADNAVTLWTRDALRVYDVVQARGPALSAFIMAAPALLLLGVARLAKVRGKAFLLLFLACCAAPFAANARNEVFSQIALGRDEPGKVSVLTRECRKSIPTLHASDSLSQRINLGWCLNRLEMGERMRACEVPLRQARPLSHDWAPCAGMASHFLGVDNWPVLQVSYTGQVQKGAATEAQMKAALKAHGLEWIPSRD